MAIRALAPMVEALTALIAFAQADAERWERYAQTARPLGYRAIDALRMRWVRGYPLCLPKSFDDRAFTAIETEWLELFCAALAQGRYATTISETYDDTHPYPGSPELFEKARLTVGSGKVLVHLDNGLLLQLVGVAEAETRPLMASPARQSPTTSPRTSTPPLPRRQLGDTDRDRAEPLCVAARPHLPGSLRWGPNRARTEALKIEKFKDDPRLNTSRTRLGAAWQVARQMLVKELAAKEKKPGEG